MADLSGGNWLPSWAAVQELHGSNTAFGDILLNFFSFSSEDENSSTKQLRDLSHQAEYKVCIRLM